MLAVANMQQKCKMRGVGISDARDKVFFCSEKSEKSENSHNSHNSHAIFLYFP